MKKYIVFAIVALSFITGCDTNQNEMKKLQQIIEKTENGYLPLQRTAAEASWKGSIYGDEAEFARQAEASKALTALFSDKETFQELKALKESGKVADPILKRELDVYYSQFLSNQADTALLNQIIERETALDQKFSAYRATYKGKQVSDNEVVSILRESTNNADLEEIWKAHKAIGREVAEDMLEIVRLRNRVAQQLGFENYHTMSLMLSEENPDEISAIFDELDEMTRDGYAELKHEMDVAFAKRYGIKESELMPWHFQDRFLQEAPNLYPLDFDSYYVGKDLEKITTDFYAGIGIDISGIMAASDLYPREKKNQHAFCTDIDSDGDVRVMCNIATNDYWMGTMLHEFGHGVYALGHDSSNLPYILRNAANTFTTEAVAMLFERNGRNPKWMVQMGIINEDEAEKIKENSFKSLRLKQLVFSRWTQVMYRFEKALYADPEQDLNALWWQLVEQYQLMKCPEGRNEPDWASKIHIALYPCYYHNYQLGELFASQMHYYIVNNITKSGDLRGESYVGNTAVGNWLKENVFNVGMKYEWNDMIERATGEKLTAKYFKAQFVD